MSGAAGGSPGSSFLQGARQLLSQSSGCQGQLGSGLVVFGRRWVGGLCWGLGEEV